LKNDKSENISIFLAIIRILDKLLALASLYYFVWLSSSTMLEVSVATGIQLELSSMAQWSFFLIDRKILLGALLIGAGLMILNEKMVVDTVKRMLICQTVFLVLFFLQLFIFHSIFFTLK
jgi:hypothetical protein